MNSFPLAFSALAFRAASLSEALALGRSWGYDGVELRLIDGELIDPDMPAAQRARIGHRLAAAGLPAVAVDSSIRLAGGGEAAAQLDRFLELASDWQAPLVRVFGGQLPAGGPERTAGLEAAARLPTAAAPRAARLGVRIGLETHDDFSSAAPGGRRGTGPGTRSGGRRRVGQPPPVPGRRERGAGLCRAHSADSVEEPQVALPQHLAVLRAWQDGGNPDAARQEAR